MNNVINETKNQDSIIKFPFGVIFLLIYTSFMLLNLISTLIYLRIDFTFFSTLLYVVINIALIIILFMKKRNNLLAILIGAHTLLSLINTLNLFISYPLYYANNILLTIQTFFMFTTYCTLFLNFLSQINTRFTFLLNKQKILKLIFIVSIIFYCLLHFAIGIYLSVAYDISYLLTNLLQFIIQSFNILALFFIYNWISNPTKIYNDKKVEINIVEKNFFIDIGIHIILLLFTFGIWQYVWIYRITNFINHIHKDTYQNPTKKLLLCIFVPFYSVYWTYKTAQEIDNYAKIKNIQSDLGTICLILSIFVSIVPPILMQSKINQIIEDKTETKKDNLSDAEALEKYKELLDKGIITEDEFAKKKKEILNL